MVAIALAEVVVLVVRVLGLWLSELATEACGLERDLLENSLAAGTAPLGPVLGPLADLGRRRLGPLFGAAQVENVKTTIALPYAPVVTNDLTADHAFALVLFELLC